MTLLQFAIVLLLGAIAVLLGVFIGYQAAQGRLRDLRARNAQLAAQLQLCEEAEVRAEALEALGEASYNALLLLDELHRVVHLNAVARRLFTVEKGSDIAPGSTLLALTRHHEIDDLVTETLESGEDVESQVMFDDQVFRVRSHLVRTDGEPLVGLALQDISELQRLGRARRDMVANVSHELRTPITSLRLLADTLKRDERLAEPVCPVPEGPRPIKRIVEPGGKGERRRLREGDMAVTEDRLAETKRGEVERDDGQRIGIEGRQQRQWQVQAEGDAGKRGTGNLERARDETAEQPDGEGSGRRMSVEMPQSVMQQWAGERCEPAVAADGLVIGKEAAKVFAHDAL